MPKIRVSTGRSSSGTVNPVSYEVIDYNHQMEYHNGVIIIMQPGWYTCTAATRGNNRNPTSTGMGVMIVVDNRVKTYSRRFAHRESKLKSSKLIWILVSGLLLQWQLILVISIRWSIEYMLNPQKTRIHLHTIQFDLVQAKKDGGTTSGSVTDEWFECRMIP